MTDLIEVSLPVRFDRDGVASSDKLITSIVPADVTPAVFDSLKESLVEGERAAAAVLWSVPAFNTSPGGVSVVHPATLRKGETLRVTAAQDGGGWGMLPPVPRDSARVGVEAGPFAASSATGTLTVVETEPLVLRLDVTTQDSLGATIRVRGEALFGFRRERRRCIAGIDEEN